MSKTLGSFYGENGRPNWPAVKAFGVYCLDNAVKIDDRKLESTRGMQLFRTVTEIGTQHPMMIKGADLEVERLIKIKTQEHEIDIFRTAVFGVGANRDGIVYMDGAISQAGSDDVAPWGFRLEYAKLKDVCDQVGVYEFVDEDKEEGGAVFVPDPDGDVRRIEITSLCRLGKKGEK